MITTRVQKKTGIHKPYLTITLSHFAERNAGHLGAKILQLSLQILQEQQLPIDLDRGGLRGDFGGPKVGDSPSHQAWQLKWL